jgi:hypothetical protein
MVSLNSDELRTKAGRLQKSVDLAVRDLLESEDHPLALALYLWVTRCHNLALVNQTQLAAWGRSWAHRVLVERDFGARADEAITAAALATAALSLNAVRPYAPGPVQGLRELLENELATRPIPFKNSSYAAVLIYAARVLGVEAPGLETTARTLASVLGQRGHHHLTFGLGFAVQSLQEFGAIRQLRAVAETLTESEEDLLPSFEDELYRAQALLLLQGEEGLPSGSYDRAAQAVNRSPVWSYLMVATEDVDAGGDGRTPVPISHFYRATLLDVVLRLLRAAKAREEDLLDRRYRGRATIGVFASLGVVTTLAAPWLVLGWLLLPLLGEGRQYWLNNNYAAMSPGTALAFLAGILLAILLALATPVVVCTLWSLLIRSAVESDRRLFEVMRSRLRKTTVAWVTLVLAVIGVANGPLLRALGDL